MNAKAYLSQVRDMDENINDRYSELITWKEKRLMLQSFDYSKDRVKTSASFEGGFENTIVRIADQERRLDEMTDEYVTFKSKAIDQIYGLPKPYSRLLYKRYIEYKSLETIAKELHYSYEHTRRLHGWALQKFERKYLS